MPDIAIVQGTLGPLEHARIAVDDLGFLRGVAVFETVRTYGGHPFALSAHTERLLRGARAIGIDAHLDEAAVRRDLRRALEASGYDEARFNLVLTPGRHQSGLFGANEPTWIVLCKALHRPDAALYRGRRAHRELSRRPGDARSQDHELPHRPRWNAGPQRPLAPTRRCTSTREAGSPRASPAMSSPASGTPCEAPWRAACSASRASHLRLVALERGLRWEDAPLPLDELVRADEVWIVSSVRELPPGGGHRRAQDWRRTSRTAGPNPGPGLPRALHCARPGRRRGILIR